MPLQTYTEAVFTSVASLSRVSGPVSCGIAPTQRPLTCAAPRRVTRDAPRVPRARTLLAGGEQCTGAVALPLSSPPLCVLIYDFHAHFKCIAKSAKRWQDKCCHICPPLFSVNCFELSKVPSQIFRAGLNCVSDWTIFCSRCGLFVRGRRRRPVHGEPGPGQPPLQLRSGACSTVSIPPSTTFHSESIQRRASRFFRPH